MAVDSIIILTEASQKIGFGHLVRCLSLQQAFQTKNVEVQIIVNGDRDECGWMATEQMLFLDWLKSFDEVKPTLKNAKLIIVDSYLAPLPIYEALADLTTLACIDDNQRIQYPIESIIINGSIQGATFNFPQKKRLVGPKFALLRKEFWDVAPKVINPTLQRAMITFGGGDLRGLTKKVLRFFVEQFPEFTKTVVVTKAFPELESILRSGDERTTFLISPQASALREAMLECDVAISSGGQTIYELARVGVPTIAITEIDNQVLNVQFWSKEKVIESAGTWNEPNLLTTLGKLILRMQSQEKRIQKSDLGKKRVDGHGSLGVAEQLTELVTV